MTHDADRATDVLHANLLADAVGFLAAEGFQAHADAINAILASSGRRVDTLIVERDRLTTENDKPFTDYSTEKSQRELFQDALTEVQSERDRLRTELADTRQQLDDTTTKLTAALRAVAEANSLTDRIERAEQTITNSAEIITARDKRIRELEAARDEARWTACHYRNAWRAQDELAEFSLGLLPGWLTGEPQPTAGSTRRGHDGAQSAQEGRTGHAEAPEYPSEGEAPQGPENGSVDLRTPQAWCDRYGLDIRDPDGWRGKDDPSWDTPITLPDFWQRCCRSTRRGITNSDYDRIIADVRAAERDGGD